MAALHKANMPDNDPRPPVALSMNNCGQLPSALLAILDE